LPDWPLLDAAERARLLKLRRPDDRVRFATTRGALRRLLGERLGCDPAAIAFAIGAHGKPALALALGADALHGSAPAAGPSPGAPHFNVSHSGAHALIALSAGTEVGVDIERIAARPALVSIARRAFHPDECAACRDGADVDGFFAIWSAKEAVFKAAGTGLGDGMTQLCVLPRAGSAEFSVTWPTHDQPLRAWRLDVADGYSAALAIPAQE